ncbi:hypothetical protein C1O25_06140 [Vibrio diazotrophicus]|uniref:Uncharacterized protein n=1 Tax=Vibrio diazotrophicus TaxID=685 RepID=A0ABX4WD54_VIBDI|nr:hypothetical protein C1O25_06140 [Vibrio diazotrophicus]
MDFFWTGRNYTRTQLPPQREIYHTQFLIFCFKSNSLIAECKQSNLIGLILSQKAVFKTSFKTFLTSFYSLPHAI